MWVPSQVIEWFTALRKDADATADVAKEAILGFREDLAAVRAERDSLRNQLVAIQINADWLRVRFNELEKENKALLEKAYGIKLPVPEIQPSRNAQPALENFSFEDIGDDMARQLGLPTYDN